MKNNMLVFIEINNKMHIKSKNYLQDVQQIVADVPDCVMTAMKIKRR